MFHFIRDNTDIGDTIVFFKPRVMRLMTDRMSISFGTWSNGSCEDTGTGDYLVVYKCEKKYENLYDAVLKKAPHRKTVFDNTRFTVIEIVSGDDSG